ncbi:MAG: outer membrane beta-barrel family protein [Muribaculaceae bacterium]|nr:outer membrane beta-barrel family protein [Muribaculaceae bacterium]
MNYTNKKNMSTRTKVWKGATMLRRMCVCAAVTLSGAVGNLMAKEVVIVAEGDNEPVENAAVTFYNVVRDSIGATRSDAHGRATVLKDGRYAMAEHDMFAPKMKQLSDGELTDTLSLKKATEIDELVVEASDNNKDLHRSYVIPRDDMKRYSNVYQALNEIPNVIVMPNNALYFEGSENVKLLLNGVDTSIIELRALDKDDILKINTYSIAPARYRVEGYDAVIDVITKSSLRGGNASISVDQAPYPLIGENSAALFYNYRSSRFSAIYSNSNNHQTRYRQSEFLDYDYDGVEYYKHKDGLDSHRNRDNNSLTLGYQTVKPGEYQYTAQLSGSISRNGTDLLQRVTSQSNPMPYDANNELYIGSNDVVLRNYFEKTLGDRDNPGTLVASLTLQRTNSDYLSRYREFESGAADPTVSEGSQYDIQFSNAVANLIYFFPYKKWGSLSLSVYDGFNYSRYLEPSIRTTQRKNVAGAWAQYYKGLGKFIVWVAAGLQNEYTYSSVSDRKQSEWNPSITAYLYYNITRSFRLSASYSLSTAAPSISQMSQTNQWLDTRLIFHGNPYLHSYTQHQVSLAAVYGSKYVDFTLIGSYSDIPGRICENFQEGPNSMLETLINLDKYRELTGTLQFSVKPLGSTIWTIDARIIGGRLKGASPTYDWTGYRFQLMPSTSLNLEKWTVYASYQYPGKLAIGQLIMPRTESWSVGFNYRPKESLSLGMSIQCPFGKGWKESQRTVAESPVQLNSEIFARDRANLVSLMLEWNVSFGKNRKRQAEQRINISTEENGVLQKL